ncbi:DUF2471 domain-containing protein [Burkholderia sp. SCN-KJ]|uniref:DUF2471 domain-containing protein n=2 Tax=unclassified Burkholderia TaxID=2613784 RepID=UPI0021503F8A|nr:DUF2471 domain-containing protein [Burkholderia sp. SCN-KJ]MCR4469815.1 DUF2471 domain-containing protein [Burkholderia sp. SCN-KJ]
MPAISRYWLASAMYSEQDQPDVDLVQYEHAVQRAAHDLQRIVATLAQRYLDAFSRAADPRLLSWHALLEIEEQAFSDLGFQGRHDPAVIRAFARLSESHLPGGNSDAAVDWGRDDSHLPTVYAIVRTMVQANSGKRV